MNSNMFNFIAGLAIGFIILILAGVMTKATKDNNDATLTKIRSMNSEVRSFGDNFNIIVIDGCEYIEGRGYNSSQKNYTHKGNCSNPFHKSK
jgi:hypothetical protein